MPRRVPLRLVLLAVIANVVLLTLPSTLRGEARVLTDDGACLGFLLLTSLLCIVDASTLRRGGDGLRPFAIRSVEGQFASALTGIALLVTFWVCIATRLDDVVRGTPPHGSWTLVGAVLMLGGIALRWSAIGALGRDFVSEARVRGAQSLETRGIYGVVRHPSEVGLIAVALGTALLLGSWTGSVVAVACLVPSCLTRVLREERVLASGFGAEHRAYARSVPALLPFVW